MAVFHGDSLLLQKGTDDFRWVLSEVLLQVVAELRVVHILGKHKVLVCQLAGDGDVRLGPLAFLVWHKGFHQRGHRLQPCRNPAVGQLQLTCLGCEFFHFLVVDIVKCRVRKSTERTGRRNG